MHSHDRTLLAKMGFADPDKKNPRHDWACQYLAQPEVLQQFFSSRISAELKDHSSVDVQTVLEHHIMKGQGQYKTTIGFADVVFESSVRTQWSVANNCPGLCVANNNWDERYHTVDGTKPRREFRVVDLSQIRQEVSSSMSSGLIEVKIAPVSVGEILRQVKLYREYFAPEEPRGRNALLTSSSQKTTDWDIGCHGRGGIDEGAHDLDARVVHGQPLVMQQQPTQSTQQPVQQLVQCIGDLCSARQNRTAIKEVIEQHYQLMRVLAIVVTDFALDSIDVSELNKSGIIHAQLGSGFEEFLRNRASAEPTVNARI